MDGGDAPNPAPVIHGDYHHTVNIGRNVDTERVMAKMSEESERVISAMMEMLNTQDRAPRGESLARAQSDGHVTSSSEGIPSAETSASPAESEVMAVDLKKVKQIFDFEGECSVIHKTSSLLQRKKFDDALPIMKTKIDLGKDLAYAQQLVSYIITSMIANSSEDNSQLRKELFELIKNKLNLPGHAVKSLADEFVNEDKSFEAILLFLLAFKFHANEADGVNSARGMVVCCLRMVTAAAEMIKKKSDSKVVVKKQILPLFSELRGKIQGMEGVPDEDKVACDAFHMYCVAFIHGNLEEYESWEESSKVGMEMMESKLPTSYMKHQVYGLMLFNLGVSYFCRQRRADAKRCWLQAVEAFTTAEDVGSEDIRKDFIESVRSLLAQTAE